MTQTDLESVLRNLASVGTPVRRDAARSIWRFQAGGKELLLYHFVRTRRVHLNAAVTTFTRSQLLQKLDVPTPRVVAQLVGFRLADVNGDALIFEVLPNAVQLDEALAAGRPRNPDWSRQVAAILAKLGRDKWRFRGLSLSSFLIADDKIYLHDLRRLRRGALKLNDVWDFAADAERFATRTELLRGWQALNPDGVLPKYNPRHVRRWRRIVRDAGPGGTLASTLHIGEWSGQFTHATQFAQPFSTASQLEIRAADWAAQWPTLLKDLMDGKLTPIKRDASGEVYAATVMLAERSIEVIVKRPFRKRWYRYLTDITRGAKAARTYRKAWQLIARNVPCEWPMLLMEKKVAGYAVDGIVVFERVPGVRMDQFNFDPLDGRSREMLFRRAGRTTRKIELGGLAHYDAKTTNWIIARAADGSSLPIIIDVDGVRTLTAGLIAFGVRRLLRALRKHPQFTPADSLAVCQGYAPFSPTLVRESEPA